MYAIEFKSTVNDGFIRIPEEYKNKIGQKVKVIILSDEQLGSINEPVFSAVALQTSGYVFNREDANER